MALSGRPDYHAGTRRRPGESWLDPGAWRNAGWRPSGSSIVMPTSSTRNGSLCRRAGYRPRPHETGTREAFAAVLDAHGVPHALLVQPSCYGVDNAAMLDAVAPAPAASRRSRSWTRQASVGARRPSRTAASSASGSTSPATTPAPSPPDAADPARPATGAGPVRPGLRERRPVGGGRPDPPREPRAGADRPLRRPRPRGRRGSAGFRAVLALGRDGQATVKLSAPFRLSSRPDSYGDLDAFVEALLDAFGSGAASAAPTGPSWASPTVPTSAGC